jgi:hypothetical protein
MGPRCNPSSRVGAEFCSPYPLESMQEGGRRPQESAYFTIVK